tara:strand:+ start:186 stop:407 length:222 start_codon:yes stop_codon:yes gene_type:complete
LEGLLRSRGLSVDGGVTANLRRSCGTSAREKSWFGGAELSSAPSAAFSLAIWVDAIGCVCLAKLTQLGTNELH